jgi:hypothetical protein
MGTPLATITIVTGLFILLAGAFQPGAHALHAAAPIVSAENPDSAATRLAPSTFIREPVVERPRAGLSAQPRTGDLAEHHRAATAASLGWAVELCHSGAGRYGQPRKRHLGSEACPVAIASLAQRRDDRDRSCHANDA